MSYDYRITTPYDQAGLLGLTEQQVAEDFWNKLGEFGAPVIAEDELNKKTIVFSLQEGLSIVDAGKSLHRLRNELERMYLNVEFEFLPSTKR